VRAALGSQWGVEWQSEPSCYNLNPIACKSLPIFLFPYPTPVSGWRATEGPQQAHVHLPAARSGRPAVLPMDVIKVAKVGEPSISRPRPLTELSVWPF
jgi:hypothetical protein